MRKALAGIIAGVALTCFVGGGLAVEKADALTREPSYPVQVKKYYTEAKYGMTQEQVMALEDPGKIVIMKPNILTFDSATLFGKGCNHFYLFDDGKLWKMGYMFNGFTDNGAAVEEFNDLKLLLNGIGMKQYDNNFEEVPGYYRYAQMFWEAADISVGFELSFDIEDLNDTGSIMVHVFFDPPADPHTEI